MATKSYRFSILFGLIQNHRLSQLFFWKFWTDSEPLTSPSNLSWLRNSRKNLRVLVLSPGKKWRENHYNNGHTHAPPTGRSYSHHMSSSSTSSQKSSHTCNRYSAWTQTSGKPIIFDWIRPAFLLLLLCHPVLFWKVSDTLKLLYICKVWLFYSMNSYHLNTIWVTGT